LADEVAPVIARAVPAAQLEQDAVPDEVLNVPATQSVQVDEADEEKRPAAHCKQLSELSAPIELDALPASHCKQNEDPELT